MVRLFTDNPTKKHTLQAVARNLATAIFMSGKTDTLKFHFKVGKSLIVWLLLFVVVGSVNGAIITITSDINWSAINNGSGPGGLPNNTDAIIIRGGHTLTVNVTNAVCASIQVGGTTIGTTGNGAGNLTFSGTGANVTVSGLVQVGGWNNANRNGTITFTNGSTIDAGSLILGGTGGTNASGTITMTAGGTLRTGSLTVGGGSGIWTPGTGTVIMTANNTLPATVFTTFNNLTCSSGVTAMNTSLTINGNLNVSDGATFTVGAFSLGVTGTTTVGNGLSGTLNINSLTGTETFTGLVTINTGGLWNNSVDEPITFQGGITNNGTFSAGNGIQTFSGNNQALTGPFSIPKVTVTGVVLTNNNSLTVGTALSGTGGLTQGGTATLNIVGTCGINTLNASAGANTVSYTNGSQNAFPTTYYNLTLSGNTMTFATPPTVNGTLDLQLYSTISITGGGTSVIYGPTATLRYDLIATGRSILLSEWPTPFTASGGVILGTGQSLQLNSATKVFSTSVPFVINSGTTLTCYGTSKLTFGGDFTNNGTIIAGNPTDFEITGTATQNIAGFNTNGGTLYMTKSSGTATLTGAVTAGSFNISGSGLSLGSATHTAGTLFLVGSGQPSGSWGGTGSAATFKNSTYFAPVVTGLLNVTTKSCTTGSWIGITSTDWNTATNWCDGVVPTSATNVIINSGVNQPVIAAGTSANCNSLTINTGATLTTASGTNTLTVAGSLTINSGASLTVLGINTLTVGGNWTNNGGTFTPGSGTVIFNCNNSYAINGTATSQTFNNINENITGNGTLSVGGSITTLNVLGNFTQSLGHFAPPATMTIGGDLTLASTLLGYHEFKAGTNLTVSGNFTQNQGIFTAPATMSVGGNFTLSDLTTYNGFTAGANLTVGGNWIYTSGTFTAGTGTVTLTGTAKTIGGSTSTPFKNLSLSGTATVSTGIVTTIGGSLNIGNGSTFTAAGYDLTVAGTTTVGGGTSGNLTISSAIGTKIFTGLVTIAAGGTWTNTSANSPVTFRGGITNNGNFNAGTGVYTFDTNNKALTGIFAIPNITVTGIILTNNNTLTVATSLSGNGGLTQAASSTLNIGTSSTITTLTASNSNNTVNFTGGAQTVNPIAYYNLSLTGSGTKIIATGTSATGNISISGANASINSGLSINAGTLTLGALGTKNGTWGSTSSTAANKNDTFFAATTGIITVLTDSRIITPVFSGLSSSQIICVGTATVSLSGTISAPGPVYPANGETVNVTINGNTQPATITGGVGGFSISYNSATLPAVSNAITYSYAGSSTIKPAVNDASTILTVNPIVSISSQSTAGQTQLSGSSFTAISVTVAGAGLSYQWYSNSIASNSGGVSLGSSNGAQTNSYTPQSTTVGTLYYYCIVTGACGTSTSAVSGAFIVNNVSTYSTAGIYTFVVPAGVTGIQVEAWGGGGAGGQAASGSNGKGGGGGGAYASGTVNVTPGNNYAVTVGAGGKSPVGQTTPSTSGGLSSFVSSIIASGGTFGDNTSTSGQGGLGGLASTSTGITKKNGGNGGNGNTATNGAGGGGGSSASATVVGVNGNNYSGSNGGAGGNGAGGNGGKGGSFITPSVLNDANSGFPGIAPGGGGGGRADLGSVSGNGANGQVIITWITVSGTSTETCIGGSTGTITATGAGGQAPYTYSSDGITYQAGSTFSGFAAGTYQIYAKDNIGRISFTNVTVNTPAISGDNQNAAGTNSWIGHIYTIDGSFNNLNYYGSYTENSETFDQKFGDGGDNYCFPIISQSPSSSRSINTMDFSVKYLMNSTKSGFYSVDLGSDDGNRLTVDNNLIYSDWGAPAIHPLSTHPNVLLNLNGASSLKYEYFEHNGQNEVYFSNLKPLLVNNLTSNIIQSICLGSSGLSISGDIYGTPNPLPVGITTTGTGYQWQSGTTSSGPWIDITGATDATYTPQFVSPFNVAGTYYVRRKASISSANNLGASANPYLATNTSNVATVTVNPLLPAGVNIVASLTGSICAGTNVTFTATPTNGGSTPSYQWKLDGTNVGSNSATYTNSTLTNGNTITCVMTSNATCATGSPATSNIVTMTVNPNLPVSISIVPSVNPVCSGTSVLFTATPTNGGTAPAYQWKVNGINAGANSTTYNYTPANNDVVTCVLTSNVTPCTMDNPATSNSITLSVGNDISDYTGKIINSSCPLISDGAITIGNSIDPAVELNSSLGNYIDLGGKLLSNLAKFTIEGWVKFNKSDIGSRMSLFGQNDAIEFGFSDASTITCWSAGGGQASAPLSSYPNDNGWHHVAAVGNGASILIYIDGVQAGTPGGIGTSNYGSDQNFSSKIGGGVWDATGGSFTGQIKKVGFWNIALTPTQLTTLASGYSVYKVTDAGLISGYNFLEGVGTSISGLGSSASTGNFISAPAWTNTNSLTYSWTGVGSFSSTTRNISNLKKGDYTITISNGICTPKIKSFTVNSDNTCSTYWMGGTSSIWNDETNWTAQYVPGIGKDVEFATAANNGTAAGKELVLDHNRTIGNLINYSGQRLLIPPTYCLTVNNTITSNDVIGDKIYIQSSSTLPNGSLIFHNPSTQKVYGTVEMYSKAHSVTTAVEYPIGSGNKYRFSWQYFGIPVNGVTASPTFDGSYVRYLNESGTTISNHWVNVTNSFPLVPGIGYEITQDSVTGRTIYFQGQLINWDLPFPNLPYTVAPLTRFPGQSLFANPYTADIDIKLLIGGFGSGIYGEIYLYSTGSLAAWGLGGQFQTVSQLTAGTSTIPGEIPSMQGFLVQVIGPYTSPNNNINIKYNSVVPKTTELQLTKASLNATPSDKVCTRIDVKGSTYTDKMWIFSEPTCTRNYDNGWDGTKMLGSALSPQLYAIEQDGLYQIDCVDDLNNTVLGFQPGQDTLYTMTFTHTNILSKYEGLFLVDLVENKTVEITESGSTYAFSAESTPSAVNRFKIVTRPYEKDAADANNQLKVFSSGNTIFVQNLGNQNGEMIVYDMMGRKLKNTRFGPYAITAVQVGSIPGAYVVSASTSSESVSKRIILGK